MPLALSVSEQVEKFGAYAGFASVVGLAVLSLLYFAQARELKRLREWAGRAPERAAELEARAAQAAQQRVVPQPQPRAAAPAAPATAAGQATVAQPAVAGAAGTAKPATPNGAPGQPAPAAAPTGAAAVPAAPAKPGAPAAPGSPAAKPPVPGAPPAKPGAPTAPAAKPAAPGAPPTGAPPVGAPAATPAAPTASPPAPGQPPRPAVPAATPAGAAPKPAQPLRAPQPSATSSITPPPRRPTGRQADDITAGGHPGRDPHESSPARATVAIVAGVAVLLAAVVFVGTQLLGGEDEPPPNTLGNQPAATAAPTGEEDGTSTTPSTSTTAVDPSEISVAVLNGTSTTGLARGVADKVEGGGFAIGTVTNAADQSRSATIVQFAPGQRRAALAVAREIGVGSDAVSEVDAGARAFAQQEDVVVTVGADQNTAGGAPTG